MLQEYRLKPEDGECRDGKKYINWKTMSTRTRKICDLGDQRTFLAGDLHGKFYNDGVLDQRLTYTEYLESVAYLNEDLRRSGHALDYAYTELT